MSSNKLSVVIIARNEADNLPRLLKSLQCADEVLVADTGSNDNTIALAREAGARVITLPWQGFGPTKQKAVEAAEYNWILSLDADEELSPGLQIKLLELIPQLTPGTAYKIKRISRYLGQPIRFCGWQNDAPLRLFHRKEAAFNSKKVHEGVKTSARIITIPQHINHYTYPFLKDHWNKINLYTSLNLLEKYNPRRHYTISNALLQGIWKFISMYLVRQGFRDGRSGLLLCLNSALGQYLKYLKLWEHQRDSAH